MSQAKKAIINFGAGPAALPPEVKQAAAEAIVDINGTGRSVLEIDHRGSIFQDILSEGKALVYELCNISPSDYEVLWLQGGGRVQFAMLPLNFLAAHQTAAYVESGYWAADAAAQALHYGSVQMIASSREAHYNFVPEIVAPLADDASYLHITTNNTIVGTQMNLVPAAGAPLVADMSSDIFGRARNYADYDMFYAVAQKNLGAAGVTLVVLKKALLEKTVRDTPPALSYAAHAAAGSVLNTPPVFNIYLSLLMLRHIKSRGLQNIISENEEKARLVYEALDECSCFIPFAQKQSRSIMNVTFNGRRPEAEQALSALAEQRNMIGIKGHRRVGGFRISLYNAIRLQDAAAVAELLRDCNKKF